LKSSWDKFKPSKEVTYVIIIIIIMFLAYVADGSGKNNSTSINNTDRVQYAEFTKQLESNKIDRVYINFSSSTFTYLDKDGNTFYTDNPRVEGFKKYLLDNNASVEEVTDNVQSSFLSIILMVGQLAIMLILFSVLFKKITPSAAITEQKENKTDIPDIKFKDIAGNRESKEDVEFLVKFLKQPKKYGDMGARITKGILFYGPPGTGKTLTAKAIAGEAGVPFFSASGSDFIEMYVGVGARRVRTLFEKAKKNAPCIVFIDEIDAIGSIRGTSNNSEKDQTINALLDAMDGFKNNTGIIVIAATNRLDSLDPALTRSGRFDRKIAIGLPDLEDRKELIDIYVKNKRLSSEISLEELAKITIGFSGADIETLLNEATILTVNRDKKIVGKEEIDDAYFRMLMQGDKKKNRKEVNKDDLELVAYHEAAHALTAKLLTENDVHKVTIIPSTSGAGGVTFNIPKKMGLFTKRDIMNDIKVSYAGRVGEFLLRGDEDLITTGASQDIKKATQDIDNLFNIYGMSKKYGMLIIADVKKETYIDEAVELSNKLYNETLELMTKNIDKLKIIAKELLEKETLTGDDLDRIIYEDNKLLASPEVCNETKVEKAV